MSAVVYHAAEVKQDLYDRITGNGEAMLLLGNTVKGDSPATLWTYDASSSASDNFAGGVIQPTLQTGNERWLKQSNFPLVPTLATVATSGSYNDLSNKPTIPTLKRQENYSGTTDSSGLYTVTFSSSFAAAPNIQPAVVGATTEQMCRIVSISTTGCVIHVFQRATVLSLALSTATTNVNGASLDILVTEK